MISTYLIPLLLLLTIAYLLWVLVKVHANAKAIDSPDAIIQELHGLRVAIGNLRKSMESGHRDTVSSVVMSQDEGFRRLIDDSLKRADSNARIQDHLVRILGEQAQRFSEIEAILGAIRDQASNADQQLRRFQDGYHWTINKSLILGVLRVLDETCERIEEERNSDNVSAADALEFVREHLDILLGNEGIVALEPTIGETYAQHRATAKAVAIPTDEPSKDATIAKVLRPGYVCDTGATPLPLVRPAQVVVFRYQEAKLETLS